ncbi:MAG TPA: transcription factor S, partial [Halobacteriales archaeon]|nr:transcription factor S [Halobacteriales archaeon]
MQFCPECGSMMHAEGDEMVCSSCGATESKDESLAEEYTS